MQTRVQLQERPLLPFGCRHAALSSAERAAADWAMVDDHQALLDLSCWEGQLLDHFSQRYALRACGICYDPLQAHQTRNALHSAEIMYAATAEIPWQASSFDRILLTRPLPASLEAEELLQEVNRVMRPGASLIVTIPCLPFQRALTLPGCVGGKHLTLGRSALIKVLEAELFVDVAIRQSRLGYAVLVARKAS
ncbi:MAG: methyltransferase domain-containing protein [Christensenellales bacterium]